VKLQNQHILILIIIVASVLRFWNYFDIAFMHDEFSALFRIGFLDFNELIEKGVKTDTHPAGVQVFMNYWILLFGNSPWIVKLPFTVMGIASIILVYKIGKLMFSETAGISSASILSVIQYHIMYSQLARPYISGVFLTLLMAWFWCKLMKNPDKQFWLNGLLMVLSGAACAYNHHFSLLQAAIIGFSGILFLPKKNLLNYAGLGLLIFILYIPHLSIFSGQLAQGGVGGKEGWLGAPDISFFWKYFYYIFHFSKEFLIITMLFILAGIFLKARNYDWKKTFVFCAWFILPLLIGYFYSIYKNPVLQYSVIIFGFPFLLLGITGLMKDKHVVANAILSITIMFFGSATLFSNRQHYKTFYESPYKEVLLEQSKVSKHSPKYLRIIDSYPKINVHYNQTLDIDTTYTWLSDFKNEHEFVLFLEENHEQFEGVYFGQFERGELIYPSIISNYFSLDSVKHYAGGSSYWFNNERIELKEIVYREWFTLAKEDIKTGELIIDSIPLRIENKEYGLSHSINLSEHPVADNTVIDVNIKLKPLEDFSEILIVSAVHRGDSLLRWNATNVSKFRTHNEWINARHAARLPKMDNHNEVLKVYLWNKDKIKLEVDFIGIDYRESNPYLYGLYNEIRE